MPSLFVSWLLKVWICDCNKAQDCSSTGPLRQCKVKVGFVGEYPILTKKSKTCNKGFSKDKRLPVRFGREKMADVKDNLLLQFDNKTQFI